MTSHRVLSMIGTLNKSKTEENHPKRDKTSEDGASKTCDLLRWNTSGLVRNIPDCPEYSGPSPNEFRSDLKNGSVRVSDFIWNGLKFSGRSGIDPDYSGSIPGDPDWIRNILGDSGRPVSG